MFSEIIAWQQHNKKKNASGTKKGLQKTRLGKKYIERYFILNIASEYLNIICGKQCRLVITFEKLNSIFKQI